MITNTTFATLRNLSQSSRNEITTEPLDICAIVLMAVIFVIGAAGNLFTVYVISHVKRTPSSGYDLLVIFLSISDLICVIIVPAMFTYATVTHFQRWDFGLVGCKILLSVLPVNVTVSQGILLLMSIDRLNIVSKPFLRQGFSKRSTVLYVAVTILVAMLLVSPRAYSLQLMYQPVFKIRTCNTPGSDNKVMLAYSIINFTRDIISTFVLAISGRKLYNALSTSSSTMAKYGCMGENNAASLAYIKQAHKLLRLILIAFSICTIPLDAFQFGVYLYFEVGGDVSSEVYFWIRSVNTVLYVLQTCNSVVNVFIYGTRHRDFKPVLRRISKIRLELFYKVAPKAQGVDLEDRNGSTNPVTISGSNGQEIRTLSMVQLGFDGCIIEDH